VAAPFGETRRLPGLAISILSDDGARVWRVRLREGVRFADGSTFNAATVLANARRWRASEAAAALLPEFLVDAPRPGLVRFILSAPDPAFDRRIASPQLGIVSPRGLRRATATGEVPARASGTGTGPFEIREREGERLLLARNTEWWGSDLGLGPGLDQLEFVSVPDPAERLALLRDGRVKVASGLRGSGLQRARRDPLLQVISGDLAGVAAERSVRGLSEAEGPAPMLNDLWLTEIAPG
jgi:ABC-type transport system substrate-binding protein